MAAVAITGAEPLHASPAGLVASAVVVALVMAGVSALIMHIDLNVIIIGLELARDMIAAVWAHDVVKLGAIADVLLLMALEYIVSKGASLNDVAQILGAVIVLVAVVFVILAVLGRYRDD
ncbi:MAG: hypothetical protein M1826_003492 [Phylliscum demangeonii]|nr:MAG: hypothetical protein M1826_003492 [Phylliscum demangeonii]